MSEAPTVERLDSLTALRFFAALMIVLYHAWYNFTGRQGIDGAGFLNFGYTSVGFFFVLSGFVLAWTWRRGTPIPTLWWRRLVRIFPLCALGTSVVLAYFLIVQRAAPPAYPSWTSFLTCFFLLQAWPHFTYLLGYNYPTWSLSTEIFFYFVFPFLMLALTRVRSRLLVPGAVVLGGAYIVIGYWIAVQNFYSLTPGSLLAFPPLQLLKFGVGVLLGTAFRRGWRPRLSLLGGLAVIALLFALMPRLVTMAGPLPRFRGTELFPDFVLVFPMAFLVCAAASCDLARRVGPGRLRPLVTLGDWSFALYLVHAPLLMVVGEIRIRTGHMAPPGLLWLAVFLVVAILVSGMAHQLFERPVERFLRAWTPPTLPKAPVS